MALFSFRHSVKTFSDKRSAEARAAKRGQTAAHLKYITRPQAARVVLRDRLSLPTDAQVAAAAEQEAENRKGRVCERFILALPIEATPDQRVALVRAFCESMTKGVAGYVAAIHDQHGNDTNNPHAHIAAFDVQVKNGGRGRPRSTIGMARKNAVEETAALWADIHNRMMADWGYGPDSQISHLSYAARGIDRLPEIHEGPGSRQMFAQGEPPATKSDWQHIDGGHSRAEANALIREINSLKEEAEHEEPETADGLGGGDEDDRGEHPDRREDEREGHRSDGRSAGTSRPPWEAPEPVGSSGEADEGSTDASTFPPFLTAKASPTRIPPFADHRCFPRWGRVRRVYRELVMLRDTLRARLFQRRQPESNAVSSARPEVLPVPTRSRDLARD